VLGDHRRGDALGAHPDGGAIDDLAHQLAAGRVDVIATRSSNRRHDTTLEHLVEEGLDDFRPRTPVSRTRERIERNEVDLGRTPLEQARQRAGSWGITTPSSITYSKVMLWPLAPSM
jgi:hypothetical protein